MNIMQKSFASGEIAPSLYSRTDLAKYASALKTCRNFVVMRHGGVQNRPGTQYVGEVKDSTKTVRLIPFIYSQSVTYVLEMGDQYMRVLKNGAYVGAPYEITTPFLEADLQLLKYAQSSNSLFITHANYAPRKITCTSDTSWTISALTFEPEINYINSLSCAAQGTTGSTTYKYTVTVFDPLIGVETPAREWPLVNNPNVVSISNGNATLNTVNFNRLTFGITSTYSQALANLEFNIYVEDNGKWVYCGSSIGSNTFDDKGYRDKTDTPAHVVEKFNSSNNYPSTCTFFQQRFVAANTNTNIDKIYLSRTNSFLDFSISKPIASDDSVIFKIASKQVNEIYHVVDLGALLIFTQSGEFVANGDGSGTITPTEINLRQSSYNGSLEKLAPIVIGNSCLFVQARGNNIRDINFTYESANYTGNELSIYSSHMFDKYQLVDWAYQQIPHSNVWVVRDDGTLLCLTYIREQSMLAWHRHDFEGGFVENVCTVPEGSEDALYLVIKRTINGTVKRYVERLASRKIYDIKEMKFVDCFKQFDGRNTNMGRTMTLSLFQGAWTYDNTITITCSSSFFTAQDVGNEIHLFDSNDETYTRVKIDSYVSGTVVRGRPNKTVPTSLRNAATAQWVRAVDVVTGLGFLEGKQVSVLADGFVVANPNNKAYQTVTVTSGSITLSECYGVITVGLPYTSDLETLNIDSVNGESIIDRSKLISKVTLFVEESRGVWAGTRPPDETTDFLDGLTELKIRDENSGYENPIDLKTDPVEIITESSWNNNGRVFVRQTDPLPLTVLSITPSGMLPFGSNLGGQ